MAGEEVNEVGEVVRLQTRCKVVHFVPETSSEDRQHVLDDEATCWCRPFCDIWGDGLYRINHRDRSN